MPLVGETAPLVNTQGVENPAARAPLPLRIYVLLAVVGFVASLGLAVFLTAGTFNYWEAWVYLTLMSVLTAGVTAFLYRRNPALLERRRHLDIGRQEHVLALILVMVSVVPVYIVPGLDHRFGWSVVPVPVVLTVDVLVVAGYLLQAAALEANSYAAATIVIAKGQTVSMNGPYSFVRHPMYLGALLTFGLTPLALGSWWGMLAASLLPLALVLRINAEEKYLLENSARLSRLHFEDQVPAAARSLVISVIGYWYYL